MSIYDEVADTGLSSISTTDIIPLSVKVLADVLRDEFGPLLQAAVTLAENSDRTAEGDGVCTSAEYERCMELLLANRERING